MKRSDENPAFYVVFQKQTAEMLSKNILQVPKSKRFMKVAVFKIREMV